MVQTDEERKAKRREYRAKNKEKINEQKRELHSKNKEGLNQKRRDKYSTTKEKHNAWKRAYRSIPENKERINKQQRESRAKNPEYYRQKDKERRLRNPEKHRESARKYHNTTAKPKFEEIKNEVFSYYSLKLSDSKTPCCNCCGESFSINFLALDHIDGRKSMGHKPSHTGIKIYREILKNDFPDGFQILCHNCNTAKFQLGTCPHETRRKEETFAMMEEQSSFEV